MPAPSPRPVTASPPHFLTPSTTIRFQSPPSFSQRTATKRSSFCASRSPAPALIKTPSTASAPKSFQASVLMKKTQALSRVRLLTLAFTARTRTAQTEAARLTLSQPSRATISSPPFSPRWCATGSISALLATFPAKSSVPCSTLCSPISPKQARLCRPLPPPCLTAKPS